MTRRLKSYFLQQKFRGKEDIARVASVSAANEEIGQLIAEAMEKVTADSVITVEESKTAETYSGNC